MKRISIKFRFVIENWRNKPAPHLRSAMKQKTTAMRFITVLGGAAVVAFIAYRLFGVGAGNHVSPSISNNKTSAPIGVTTSESNLRRIDNAQPIGKMALQAVDNPARDHWMSLTNAVVTSQDWAQTIATLKDHPDANRWLIIMSFQLVCLRVQSHTYLEKSLPKLFLNNPRIPSSERQSYTAMSNEALKRCGNEDDLFQRTKWRSLPEVIAVPMGISPGFYDGFYKTGVTGAQSEAIEKIIRTPEQLSQWLTLTSLESIPADRRPEYFKQLKPNNYTSDDGEFSAVNWLITCELGDGCGRGSIHRFQACLAAFYCSGNSVFESIETRHGAERSQVIRTVANLFLADLSKRGVDVFGFPKKKTP